MDSDSAGTGLALLAFLGAGYTHQDNKYRDVVAAGLQSLLARQKADGDLFSGGSKYCWLYSHGIASIALCEAYGMTRDPQLREPAQRALDFIIAAQNESLGGWRYAPGIGSDTSVSGWQVMALKSGELASLKVPPQVYDNVHKWLNDGHAPDDSSRYSYMRRFGRQSHHRAPSRTMTAEALLMRLYLDWTPAHPSVTRGADYLLEELPRYGTPTEIQRNSYYWYYATQVMYHVQGERWEKWNSRLRELLIQTQETQGGLAGSWNPDGAIPDRWGEAGGRIYITAMDLLMLEVYYRRLPLYRTADVKDVAERP